MQARWHDNALANNDLITASRPVVPCCYSVFTPSYRRHKQYTEPKSTSYPLPLLFSSILHNNYGSPSPLAVVHSTSVLVWYAFLSRLPSSEHDCWKFSNHTV